jgi:hypothetical protein
MDEPHLAATVSGAVCLRSDAAARAADPAINAAFVAFHRNAGLIEPVRGRPRVSLGGGALVFSALSIAGVGGALFFAFFCFNTPDAPVNVTAVAPEVIYARPANERSMTDLAAQPNALVGDAFASVTPRADEATDANAASTARRGLEGAGEDILGAELLAQARLPDATANFAAAQRLGFAGGSFSRAGGTDLVAGYDAEELPTIPEPSTGAAVAIVAALLVASNKLIRRRPSQS